MGSAYFKKIWRELIVLCAAAVFVFGPIIYFEVYAPGATDYSAHTTWAHDIFSAPQSLPVSVITHAGWQCAVNIVHAIVGYSWDSSALMVTLGSLMASAGVLFWMLRKKLSPLLAGSLAIGLLLVGPLAFFFPFDGIWSGYIWSNVYHNPTILLLQPFAILQFYCAVDALYGSQTGWKGILFAFLVSGAAAYVKPNYILCLLPAVGLLALIRGVKKQAVDWKRLLIGIGLPSLALLVWQFVLTYSQNSDSSVILAPFVVMRNISDNLLPKFLMSMVFPLLVTILYWKDAVRDVRIQLGWSGFIVGALLTYFFAESGPRLVNGNFLWSGEIALLILFVSCILFLADKPLQSSKPYGKWLILTSGFLHVYFGIAYYCAEIIKLTGG